ncbi:ribosomal RNA large subunit methyltransferase H [Bacteroidia bacterium]|nr:ribosomal RNA large subunit methyltransferase H [Bacteroidia bacterium]GHU92941.1 ribosomal RNA large subunit methyltransferase H [Bacteroidia bacterium]GHV23620.1 ribosomal RNA large subunit methyltransferase H [Bacteroidia bacterium]
MKIVLFLVGKTTQDFVQKGMDEFCSRLRHYLPFDVEVLPDIKNTKNFSFGQVKEREGELILKTFQPGDYVVLLDEKGKEFSSLRFADYLEKKMHVIPKRLVFVIGGPYGFSEKVYETAQEKISLSKMTFSHQLIRLVFAEQLYRAMTILNHEPYHHE